MMDDDIQYEIKIKAYKNDIQNILKVNDIIRIIMYLQEHLRTKYKHADATKEQQIVVDEIIEKLWGIIEDNNCEDLFG